MNKIANAKNTAEKTREESVVDAVCRAVDAMNTMCQIGDWITDFLMHEKMDPRLAGLAINDYDLFFAAYTPQQQRRLLCEVQSQPIKAEAHVKSWMHEWTRQFHMRVKVVKHVSPCTLKTPPAAELKDLTAYALKLAVKQYGIWCCVDKIVEAVVRDALLATAGNPVQAMGKIGTGLRTIVNGHTPIIEIGLNTP
jgi:hypothetical protein